MKTAIETPTTRRPSRVFILAERWILSMAMTVLALVVERRLIKAIKRTA
jgi:hypothetical protein